MVRADDDFGSEELWDVIDAFIAARYPTEEIVATVAGDENLSVTDVIPSDEDFKDDNRRNLFLAICKAAKFDEGELDSELSNGSIDIRLKIKFMYDLLFT
jgi:hypothetical protein